MRNTEFQQKMSYTNIPAFVRNEAQKALSMLRVDGDGTILVNRDTFNLICKHAQVEPTKGAMFTFIRIYDEFENSVDIQMETSLLDTLGDALRPTKFNYPNPLQS